MKKIFYSNGKLLITGEYVVLDGAIAFALPTKMGQSLIVDPGFNKEIIWKSYDNDRSIWFDEVILFSDVVNQTSFKNNNVKTTLVEILHHAYLLNPDFIENSDGYEIKTVLTFPKFWGLGTSSTLINNIASWLQIDAFVLLKNSFGGSGYDIACAQNDTAILYQLVNQEPIVKPLLFNPEFKNQIYFVYLNKKQNSKTAIANYRSKRESSTSLITEITEITTNIANLQTIEEFTKALDKHEMLMSKILEIPTVKSSLFSDFEGTIKSLGAWGGDFVMAVSKENPTEYFNKKGYGIVIPHNEMIL